MKLLELLTVTVIISILASLLLGPTSRALSLAKKTLKRIELKKNQDIMAAIDEGTTYIELNGRLYLVSDGSH